MASLEEFLDMRLKLKVNQAKSAVARPSKRQFLGYTIVGGSRTTIRISMLSCQRFRAKVRAVFRGVRGRTLPHTILNNSIGCCADGRLISGWPRRNRRWQSWTSGYGTGCAVSSGGSGNAFTRVNAI